MAKRKSGSKGKTPKKIKNNKENEDIEETVDPDIDDDEEDEEGGEGQYVVESVVDKRKRNGKIEYFIKWKDYSSDDNTWERMSNTLILFTIEN